MAAPISKYSFQPNPQNPLEILFQGILSSNGETIDTWAWDFGPGSNPQNSNQQSQVVQFGASGVQLISLTVSNADGQDTMSAFILISEDPAIMMPIINMVECKIPKNLLDYPCAMTYIRKWQLWLQPQVNPTSIPNNEVYNEAYWPPLYNVLIAELVVYELLMEKANKMMIEGNIQSNQNSQVAQDGTVTTVGGLKKLETGPSSAEWYDAKFNDLEQQTNFAKTVFSYGTGMIEQYKQYICILSRRLRVSIYLCDELSKPNLIFVKSKKPKRRWTS